MFFTHGNYLRNYTGDWDTKADFYGKKIVMLVRDPRDVAVSQFFQWKFRMKRNKKALNWYPPHGADVSLYDFVMNEDAGLPCIIEFFNTWARELPRVSASMVIRYEDMRKDPAAVLRRLFDFLGTPGSDAEIQDAVNFAAYENMKQLEEKRVFGERHPAAPRRQVEPGFVQGPTRQGRRLAGLLRRARDPDP